MLPSYIHLKFSFVFCLLSHSWILSSSLNLVNYAQKLSRYEYHLHACGRAVSAIKNFHVIAAIAVSHEQVTPEIAEKALDLIERSLTKNYQTFFIIEDDQCLDIGSLKPAAVAYQRNRGHIDPNTPNFSYRFI